MREFQPAARVGAVMRRDVVRSSRMGAVCAVEGEGADRGDAGLDAAVVGWPAHRRAQVRDLEAAQHGADFGIDVTVA